MTKEELLKSIAEVGYNIGFGAKKHFATYDLVDKIPGLISLISMIFGIYALVFDELSTKFLSASFLILGIIGLYISFYDSKKLEYEKNAKILNKLYNDLSKLYRRAKSSDPEDFDKIISELQKIEEIYDSSSISKQILFSDWYAHYKFFWQHQIDWINEQKKFRFIRDKVPLSFWAIIISTAICLGIYWTDFTLLICN